MKKLSLRGKLLCVLTMLAVVAVIISVIGITKLSGMNQRLDGIVNVSAAKVNLSNEVNVDLLAISTNMKNLILADTQEEMDTYAGVIDKAADNLRKTCDELDELVDNEGKKTLARFTQEMEQYLAVVGQIRELSRRNSNVKADKLSKGEARQAFEAVAEKAEALAEKNEAALLASLKNANMATEADQARKALLALRIEAGLIEIQRAEKNIILAKTEEEMDSFAAAIDQNRAEIEKETAELGELLDDEGKALYNEFTAGYERWIALHQQVRALSRENSNAKAFTLAATTGQQHLAQCDELVAAFVEKNLQQMEEDKAASSANYAAAKWMMIVTSIVGCGAAIVLGLLIITGVNRTLNRIVAALSAGSEQTAAASSQVSASSQSLAEGASEQAAALEETSSSLEEMSSMTKRNAASAEEAKNLAAEAKASAENGNTAMQRMSNAINDIQKSSAETAKIIKVIDEIAFQTNLLALNAAVEAARAGEAGKGFAVVAEEVRNLAMRSADAAKNTSELIEDSVKRSENGVGIAGEVAEMLGEISGAVVKVNDLVAEITAASQEQAQGIEQVNVAVSQMDKVTQQTAANAEESASASEELNAQAEQLTQIVGELSAVIGGAAGESAMQTHNRHPHHAQPVKKEKTSRISQSSKTEAQELIPLSHEVTVGQDFSEFGSTV